MKWRRTRRFVRWEKKEDATRPQAMTTAHTTSGIAANTITASTTSEAAIMPAATTAANTTSEMTPTTTMVRRREKLR